MLNMKPTIQHRQTQGAFTSNLNGFERLSMSSDSQPKTVDRFNQVGAIGLFHLNKVRRWI